MATSAFFAAANLGVTMDPRALPELHSDLPYQITRLFSHYQWRMVWVDKPI